MTTTMPESRARRLKAMTHDMHERLDGSLMSVATFASLDGYGRFLTMQCLFHRDIAALYDAPDVLALMPDLPKRRRLPQIERDLADLGHPAPAALPPVFKAGEPIDTATALGWLYVAEGSNLGASLLRKEVARIGLSDRHGGRHLAPAPEGPAAHWRAFTAVLDGADLDAAADERMVDGARAAFARVQDLANACVL